MKELKLYVCETCHTQYADKRAAQECEELHRRPQKITGCRYRPIKDDATGYPQTITVRMNDGKSVTYQR